MDLFYLAIALTIVFAFLKIVNAIFWSWWIVLLPLFFYAVIYILVFVAVLFSFIFGGKW